MSKVRYSIHSHIILSTICKIVLIFKYLHLEDEIRVGTQLFKNKLLNEK